MVDLLKRTYCGRIGYEFMHINDAEQKDWLQRRIEGPDKEIAFTPEGKKAILNKLIEAEGFEKFAALRFVGTKRFGLDGGEAMIPALEQIIKRGGQLGVKEIVLGMPHRGRLNVLANVMAKPYRQIFHEFQGGNVNPCEVARLRRREISPRRLLRPRIRRQSGASVADRQSVASGSRRSGRAGQGARQAACSLRQAKRASVLPLLMHGDAAFAGQGVVAECFAMSGTKGFRTGGTVHFVVNNQIGFTTAPIYSRSSPYPTDLALMRAGADLPCERRRSGSRGALRAHRHRVPPAVPQRRGVDMFCYRRFGHNERDEPASPSP